MYLSTRMLAAFLASFAARESLSAQTPSVCDAGAKGGLARVAFSVEQARAASGTPAAASLLSSAIKQVESASNDDAAGRALLLGQSLSLWLAQPGVSLTPKRSMLGFVSNGDATIDLIGAIDSSFRVVETAKPACLDLTNAYRGGLAGYINLVNGAINSLNADKLDSAEFYSQQAYRLYPGSPYATMVLGSVASKRNNNAKAIEYWTASAAAAGKDSAYREVQRQVLSNAGFAYLSMADQASGAERSAAAKRAADLYAQLVVIPGTKGSYLSGGRQNYQRALLLAGDTSAFVASYSPLIANPGSYDYQDLLSTAVNVARANKGPDAAKLFEASLAQNPFSRDALYNLGLTLLVLNQNDRVPALVTRLVSVDPANPENYNLAARAYLALAKEAKAAKNLPAVAAYNDSTVLWYQKGNKLTSEVMVNEFTPGDKQVTIGGRITDRRDKIVVDETPAPISKGSRARSPVAKPAAPNTSPTPVRIKIDALDRSGAVLGSETVTTEPLTPGKTVPFHVTIQAANAVSFRYSSGV